MLSESSNTELNSRQKDCIWRHSSPQTHVSSMQGQNLYIRETFSIHISKRAPALTFVLESIRVESICGVNLSMTTKRRTVSERQRKGMEFHLNIQDLWLMWEESHLPFKHCGLRKETQFPVYLSSTHSIFWKVLSLWHFSLCAKYVESFVQKKSLYLFSLPAHLALFQDEPQGHWN